MNSDMSTTFHRSPGWWYDHPETSNDHIGVLNALMRYADVETFTCFPSQQLLAAKLRKSRAWVNKIIRELVEFGLIQKTHRIRKDRGMSSCEYRIFYQDPRPTAVPVASDVSEIHEISAVPTVTGGVNENDRNKTQTNKNTLSDILIEDWNPKMSTLEAISAAVGQKAAEKFVVRFRAKVAAKGYQYADFDIAILEWFEEDRQRGLVPQPQTSGQSRGKSVGASQSPSVPVKSLEQYIEETPEIELAEKQAVRDVIAGKPVSSEIDLGTRFRAACLYLAHSKTVNIHKMWLSGLRAVECKGGVLRVTEADRLKRQHVKNTYDSSLTASCRLLGIEVGHIVYEQ